MVQLKMQHKKQDKKQVYPQAVVCVKSFLL